MSIDNIDSKIISLPAHKFGMLMEQAMLLQYLLYCGVAEWEHYEAAVDMAKTGGSPEEQ